MNTSPFSAPIDSATPELLKVLGEGRNLVLQAPPGAGKTTRVPLALLDQSWAAKGKILMLEPRRVAARAAAQRMAQTLGEPVGETVGYRIRNENKTSKHTRVIVATEGVLTRMLQTDPELSGVAAVLFDEFHERSIHADLGLALCLEAQEALRPDLRLAAMSATLDGEAVAQLMKAQIVTSEGRSFPVETRWLDTPWNSGRGRTRFEDAAAALTLEALAAEPGDALVFLPGAPEIRRVETALKGRTPANVDIRPIYGELPFAKQQAALTPAPKGRRKIVLATAIAETSLTIEGVRIVVDAGRARRARFDPGSGMSRLVTERVSKAAAAQRRGRAGRTQEGVCFRMWTKGEEGALAAFDPPEILEADLAPVALELAIWGASPDQLPFLDAPPNAHFKQAQTLLQDLGALDNAGAVTAHGRAMAAAPTHPRLAHMVLKSGGAEMARRLAALLEERDPLRGVGADVNARLKALSKPKEHPNARAALARILERARSLGRFSASKPQDAQLSCGGLLALAYPDRIGVRRKGQAPRFLLSGGKGALLPEDDGLAGAPLIVAADLDGDAREAKIYLAAPIARSELDALYGDKMRWEEVCEWSKRDRAVTARKRLMLEAATLEDRLWKDAPPEELAAGMLEGVRRLGLAALPWTPAAERLRARVLKARSQAPQLPDWSDEGLLEALEDWLGPHLIGMRAQADLAGLNLAEILHAALPWDALQKLDACAPAQLKAPGGASAPIDYSGEQPRAAFRLQALFGLDAHPQIGGEPVLIDLLSPAQRPIQTTADLPGFWRGSYADVRKDMRARYPKHDWPEEPWAAQPHVGVKRRKG